MYFVFYKKLMVFWHFSQDEKAKLSCLQLLHKDMAPISSTWGQIDMNIHPKNKAKMKMMMMTMKKTTMMILMIVMMQI